MNGQQITGDESAHPIGYYSGEEIKSGMTIRQKALLHFMTSIAVVYTGQIDAETAKQISVEGDRLTEAYLRKLNERLKPTGVKGNQVSMTTEQNDPKDQEQQDQNVDAATESKEASSEPAGDEAGEDDEEDDDDSDEDDESEEA